MLCTLSFYFGMMGSSNSKSLWNICMKHRTVLFPLFLYLFNQLSQPSPVGSSSLLPYKAGTQASTWSLIDLDVFKPNECFWVHPPKEKPWMAGHLVLPLKKMFILSLRICGDLIEYEYDLKLRRSRQRLIVAGRGDGSKLPRPCSIRKTWEGELTVKKLKRQLTCWNRWGVYGLYRETRESETREEVIGTRRKKRDKGLAFWGESFGDGGKGKVQEKYIGGGLIACRGWFDLICGETGQRKPRIEDNFQKHGGIFQ